MRLSRTTMAVLLASVLAPAALAPPAVAQRTAQSPGLSSFANDGELRSFLRLLARSREQGPQVFPPPAAPPPPPPPPAAPMAEGIVVTGARAAPAGITNTQVAGVDEGGIVKLSGETLVVLRRGRLFTISLAGGRMRPIASIDAYPPGVDGSGDWYDEMLLSGDRVIVVGYSYARGGTEVNRFRLGADGSLRFEDSTQLRSNDYYSSRNYASRLIGSTLIYYTPLGLDGTDGDPMVALPAIRRWQPGRPGGGWQRIVGAQRVFVPARLRRARDANIDTIHSVTRCDLAAPTISCAATAVFGSSSRSFFVSTNAIYVWTAHLFDSPRAGASNALLYRIPIDGRTRPQAVAVSGAPIDQFSFSPDEARGALNVVVRSDGEGDGMWRPERGDSAVALLRLPMRAFGDGSGEAMRDRYQLLPAIDSYPIQNRFVGDHLLLGADGTRQLTTVGVGDRRVTQLPLPHDVGRLDIMGRDAIVVGDDPRGLGFSTIALGAQPRRTDTFVLPAAREGEARSHAFFFRPDSADGRTGLVGLPVARSVSQGTRYLGPSSALQFLARASGRLADAGELQARGTAPEGNADGCKASCVDWYGNARPIFWNGRVFALMGYELVEGSTRDRRIREVARVDFTPRRPSR